MRSLRNISTRKSASILLLFSLLMLFVGATTSDAHAAIKISFNILDGSKISNVASITAHVKSKTLIAQVEFFVDGQSRAVITGIPYRFKWDTISDTEGKHTLKVVATDVDGDTAQASISVIIDNDLSIGAPALAAKAVTALKSGDAKAARNFARCALKADPNNIDGAAALATIYAQAGNYQMAANTLSGVKELDSNSPAMLQLSGYQLRLALMPENADHAVDDVKSALALRRKAADNLVQQIEAVPGTDPIKIGDALMSAGHPHKAISSYLPVVSGNNAPVSAINRLALAYVQTTQYYKAENLLRTLQIQKLDNTETRTVFALLLVREQKPKRALILIANDIPKNIPSVLVVASYANTLLDNKTEADKEAVAAENIFPQAGDAVFAHSLAAPDPRVSSEEAIKTLSLAPFYPAPYVDYGARIALQSHTHRLVEALQFADIALSLDPGSLSAQIMRGLLLTQVGHSPDARQLLDQLYGSNEKYPDLLLAMSAYCVELKQSALASIYFSQAQKSAPSYFINLQTPPDALQALETLYRQLHYRPGFFLTISTLYPPTDTSNP